MAAPRAVAAKAASTAQEQGISTLGSLFFGSLCASTFGLGCWQSQRYFEKIEQIDARTADLEADPVPLGPKSTCSVDELPVGADGKGETQQKDQPRASYRRLVTQGQFQHGKEVYVGPRGPPPGALAKTGPSSGRSSGGMASSPQGYYVVTPLVRSNGMGTILVNRGWVPMQYVKQHKAWERPTGTVNIVGVAAKAEKPKFFSPEHDKKDPTMLIWMDRPAMEAGTGTEGLSPMLFTETSLIDVSESDNVRSEVTFPVKPNAETVGEFKVTPFTHAGYAVTWFGLSGAGIVMTRKLITRGRG